MKRLIFLGDLILFGEGIDELFSSHIISGIAIIIFICAMIIAAVEDRKKKKYWEKIQNMDEKSRKTYYLISNIKICVPLYSSIAVEIYYYFDRVFVKGDKSGIKEMVVFVVVTILVVIMFLIFKKKPGLQEKLIHKIKKFYGWD